MYSEICINFESYVVTRLYVFRADSWALYNQLVCSSLEKPTLPLTAFFSYMSFLCKAEAS